MESRQGVLEVPRVLTLHAAVVKETAVVFCRMRQRGGRSAVHERKLSVTLASSVETGDD